MGRSGRGKGRGKNKGRGRGSGGRTHSARSNTVTNKKSFSQYVFYLGSTKQSSDYEDTARFLLNHIRVEYDEDIYTALKTGEEFDFTKVKPKENLDNSTEGTNAEKAKRAAENDRKRRN